MGARFGGTPAPLSTGLGTALLGSKGDINKPGKEWRRGGPPRQPRV